MNIRQCSAIFVLLVISSIHIADCSESNLLCINVKDYGTKGDGIADDTLPLQKAFDAAHALERPFNLGQWEATEPEIIIPEGTYRTTNMLRISNACLLRGEGKVVIRAENPILPVLDVHWALRIVIENIVFDGGLMSVHLFTANSAGAQIAIRDCVFKNAKSYAIQCIVKGVNEPSDERWFLSGYYQFVQKENGVRAYKYYEDPHHSLSFNSTVLHIENCVFDKCNKVANLQCDLAVMDNCSIETSPEMEGHASFTAGITKLQNVKGLAHLNPDHDQYWLDVRDCVLIGRNVELKTDSAQGICIAKLYNKWRDTVSGGYQKMVVFDNSVFQSAGCPEDSILYAYEIPNIIALRNCVETSGKPVKAISFNEKLSYDGGSLANYLKRQMNGKLQEGIHESGLDYIIDAGNSKNITTSLLAELTPYVRKDVPIVSNPFADTSKFTLSRKKMRERFVTKVDVTMFGAVGDGKTDNTEAFQKAVQSGKPGEPKEIIIPAGHYNFTDTVKIGSDVYFRAAGSAWLKGPETKTLFSISNARNIYFSNLIFGPMDEAINFTASSKNETNLLVDRCTFGNISGTAIKCLTETGKVGEENLLHFRITDSTFSYNVLKCFETNARYAMFDNSWGFTSDKMEDTAAIVNKGSLLAENICGNPCPGPRQGMRQRWIDNYYRLSCSNFRFGGEGAGVTAICQKSDAKGTYLLLENSPVYALSAAGFETWLYLERIPSFMLLRTNFGLSGRINHMISCSKEVENKLGWKKSPNMFFSGNGIPLNDVFQDKQLP